uniref:SGNH hydrolase-type esterase domain-containing protein n=1 Tax=Magallana gigas TaxID=29159 RepID=K1PR21_MAGGI
MPGGKPKANKDKGATCSGAGSRTRKRRAERQLNFQQPTFSAIQVKQVPSTAVEEHQQAATSTGIENPTTSASTWQVWCVGSSIIKHAFLAAMLRTGEINLGLERLGIKIWWQGYAGLKFTDLKKKVMYLTRLEEAPDFLVIHCRGNDLGDPDWPLAELIEHMSKSITSLDELLPKTKLVWSQILPRKSYRYSSDLEAMKRNRKRFNRATACQIQELRGGRYIKHPDIMRNINQFLGNDNVHLNPLGNIKFLCDIQGALNISEKGFEQYFQTNTNKGLFHILTMQFNTK